MNGDRAARSARYGGTATMTKKMTEAEYRAAVRETIKRHDKGAALLGRTIDDLEALAVDAGAEFAPEPVRIKRGDVIESPEDAERYDVPTGTVFREPNDIDGVVVKRGRDRLSDGVYFPLRCIDVPGEPVTEQKHETVVYGGCNVPGQVWRWKCTCGGDTGPDYVSKIWAELGAQEHEAEMRKAAQS